MPFTVSDPYVTVSFEQWEDDTDSIPPINEIPSLPTTDSVA